MRGKKVKRFRKLAIAKYPPGEANQGYEGSTYYGPQWRRYLRYLKRG